MAYDYADYDNYDYEDEERIDDMEYEKLNLPWPGGPYLSPVRWYVEGTLTGDIKWNNIDAVITLCVPYDESNKSTLELLKHRYGVGVNLYVRSFYVKVRPFTHNCGIKAIEDLALSGSDDERKLFITYLESFLWYKCNVGIIVGSDYVHGEEQGGTGLNIKKYGTGYTCEEPTWNPNYTWTGGKKHKIFLFHKQLTEANVPVNYWS